MTVDAVDSPSGPGGALKRMTDRITPRQFHEADGVDDWRVLFGGACAHFRRLQPPVAGP